MIIKFDNQKIELFSPFRIFTNVNNINHNSVLATLILITIALLLVFSNSYAKPQDQYSKDHGIYLTQSTLQNTSKLSYLIRSSKQVGINTFVIDLKYPNNKYKANIQLVKNSGIKYVVRIVVFPRGGNKSQVKSQSYWQNKFKLVKTAIEYGADEIQLDYIRYNTKQRASWQNVDDILTVIKWFRSQVQAFNKPLQIDIFGEVSYKPSLNIGQDIKKFANDIDVVCPMVYPSHYRPYVYHSKRPYQTIYSSLTKLKARFNNDLPFKLVPYIEASNPRYRISGANKIEYIKQQIKAVEDSGADGWYFWSPNNQYNAVFAALKK